VADGFRCWLVYRWKYISTICIGTCPLSPTSRNESEDQIRDHLSSKKPDQNDPILNARLSPLILKVRARKRAWAFAERTKVGLSCPTTVSAISGNGVF
jgi:hypothetical protein